MSRSCFFISAVLLAAGFANLAWSQQSVHESYEVHFEPETKLNEIEFADLTDGLPIKELNANKMVSKISIDLVRAPDALTFDEVANGSSLTLVFALDKYAIVLPNSGAHLLRFQNGRMLTDGEAIHPGQGAYCEFVFNWSEAPVSHPGPYRIATRKKSPSDSNVCDSSKCDCLYLTDQNGIYQVLRCQGPARLTVHDLKQVLGPLVSVQARAIPAGR